MANLEQEIDAEFGGTPSTKTPQAKEKPILTEATKERIFGGLPIEHFDDSVTWLNVVIYGEPGSGKTVLAGSASKVDEMCPILYLDTEQGRLSLKKFYPEAIKSGRLDVVPVNDFKRIQKIYDELERGKHGYKTVVIDTLSELQRKALGLIMDAAVLKDSERDRDVPAQREWGKVGEQIERLVGAFRDLSMHSIFICHVNTKDDVNGITKGWPGLRGRMGRDVAGMVDEVFYLFARTRVKNKEQVVSRFIQTGSTDTFTGKDRSDQLSLLTPEPNMTKIYNSIIYNKKEEENAED